jgi:hypothetical protein
VQNAAVLLTKLNNARRRVIMELGHKFWCHTLKEILLYSQGDENWIKL